jgi:hypothetical protein
MSLSLNDQQMSEQLESDSIENDWDMNVIVIAYQSWFGA